MDVIPACLGKCCIFDKRIMEHGLGGEATEKTVFKSQHISPEAFRNHWAISIIKVDQPSAWE